MITRTVDVKRAQTNTTMITYDPTIPPPIQNNNSGWHKTYPRPQPAGLHPPRRANGVRPMRPNRPMNVGNTRTITKRPVAIPYGPQKVSKIRNVHSPQTIFKKIYKKNRTAFF